MAYPRRDRRSPAQDVYGKPGVSYPEGSFDHPVIVETDDGRQTPRAPTAMLTAHPASTKYAGAKKTGHKSSPGENANTNVTEVFETLPGVPLDSFRLHAGGNLVRTRTQKVVATTLPASADNNTLSTLTQIRDANVTESVIEQIVSSAGAALSAVVPMTVEEEDEETGAVTKTWLFRGPPSHELPAHGASSFTIGPTTVSLSSEGRRRIPTFPAGYGSAGGMDTEAATVVKAEQRDLEGTDRKLIIIQTSPLPYPVYDTVRVSFQFPAEAFLSDLVALVNGRVPLGTSGHTYRSHRTRSVMALRIRRFSNGIFTGNIPATFYVDTPASAAVYFSQYGPNTIYRADAPATDFEIFDTTPTLIEAFPFSTPSEPPDFYLYSNDQRRWRGEIFFREYVVLKDPEESNGATIATSIIDDAYGPGILPAQFESGGSFYLP